MLQGMSPNGMGLANTAVLVSMVKGLIEKGVIDRAEARLWLNNAITMIEEDRTPSQRNADALAIIRNELAVRMLPR